MTCSIGVVVSKVLENFSLQRMLDSKLFSEKEVNYMAPSPKLTKHDKCPMSSKKQLLTTNFFSTEATKL